MRGNEFLDKMELIDPSYIEGADVMVSKKKSVLIRLGVVAACLSFTVFAEAKILSHENKKINSDMPMLSVSEITSTMGYEGYTAYDISELVNANPWNEDFKLSTLPVYQNTFNYDENNFESGVDLDKIRKFILEIANRAGLDENNLTVTYDTPDEEEKQKIIDKFNSAGVTVPKGYFTPTKLIINSQGIEIEADSSMTATVHFEPALAVPSEYNFTHFSSYNDKCDVAEYLKTKYKSLIGIENPQADIFGGDYNIYGQQQYSVGFFEDGQDKTEKIINYNFNRVTFANDDDGKLFIVRICQPDLSVKAGDYPVISSNEARQLLIKGNFITTVPYEFSGEEFIEKTELIYRTDKNEKYFMPYYRFYVELPELKQEDGLKTYGIYYVPAVESTYISDMPVWDGSFS
ncbi:MAG: hypothetical protein IJP18_09020 [Oscillospiraceae bacterium]|nr:hypothetical protein [Oscillospiraceae bacterium]